MLLLPLLWLWLQPSLTQAVFQLPTTTTTTTQPEELLGFKLITAAPKPTEPTFFTNLPIVNEPPESRHKRWYRFYELLMEFQPDLLSKFIDITDPWLQDVSIYERISTSNYFRIGQMIYEKTVNICGTPCESEYTDYIYAAALYYKIRVKLIRGVCCPNHGNFDINNSTEIDVRNNNHDMKQFFDALVKDPLNEFFQYLEEGLETALEGSSEVKSCLKLFHNVVKEVCGGNCPDKQHIYLAHRHCANDNIQNANSDLVKQVCCPSFY